uniref:AgCP14332 n=1 Tax=Anopheles gambiae TaxID=7165 RepID=Q6VQR5_ANOGA|nr:agCP14332 [Anopheles gambiae]
MRSLHTTTTPCTRRNRTAPARNYDTIPIDRWRVGNRMKEGRNVKNGAANLTPGNVRRRTRCGSLCGSPVSRAQTDDDDDAAAASVMWCKGTNTEEWGRKKV